MKKILIINNVPFHMGGMSSVIVNYINNMNKDGLAITLIVNSMIEKSYKNILLENKIKIIMLRRNSRVIGYMYDLYKIMKKEQFDVVHVHGNSSTMVFETLPAYLNKIPKRIVHSHNVSCQHKFINKLLWPILKITYTLALACSSEAGEWLFKDRRGFFILNNAIDLNKYKFNKDIRKEMRNELGLNDVYTLGHIGYFNDQKNHEKLFGIVNYLKDNMEIKLLCISGSEEIPNNIKELIKKHDLEKHIEILLRRDDVEKLLHSMDFFLFPSKFEGLGLALIEAQAAGLHCLASDKVPIITGVCKDLVDYCELDHSEMVWANNIMCKKELDNREEQSINAISKLKEAGYDILIESEKLRKIYIE